MGIVPLTGAQAMTRGACDVRTSKGGERAVILTVTTDSGPQEVELPPLGAAWLAGAIMAASLELLNGNRSLGVHPESFAPVVLWENWNGGAGGSWNPSFLTTVQQVRTEITRCQKEGIPYRLTVDMVTDPLESPTPKG